MDLTHFNEQGRAKMVDVSEKKQTLRTASAVGKVLMSQTTLEMIKDKKMAKGDVLAVAQVAGIMATKRTSELIPMCHPIALTAVNLSFNIETDGVSILSEVRCKGETGVEMEALTAVSTAALTIYDMCKAVQKNMTISAIRVVKKSGGKNGDYIAKEESWQK